MKFVFRISGDINSFFVCWGNRVARENYFVITSELASVASFCYWFCSKKLARGLRTVYHHCFLVLSRE